MLSAICFNLDQSEILSSDDGFIHHFKTVPNSKKLQTTTEMWLVQDFKIQFTVEQFHILPQCFPQAQC